MKIAELLIQGGTLLVVLGSLIYARNELVSFKDEISLSRRVAVANALGDAVRQVGTVVAFFLDYPEMRPYFYDGADPRAQGLQIDSNLMARVQTVAELLADAVDGALDVAKTIGAEQHYGEWKTYVVDLLESSPIFLSEVRNNSGWWPCLEELVEENTQDDLAGPAGATAVSRTE